MSQRLPAPDHDRILATKPRNSEVTLLPRRTRLTRLHFLGGAHPSDWHAFRTWGPTTSRFDHHPEPVGDHPAYGILYAGIGNAAFTTVLAECFASGSDSVGPIDRGRNRPMLTIFSLEDELRLLRLEGGWVTRAGGNQAICSGERDRARMWAREIHSCFADIDGVTYTSSVWGPGTCVALWERAARALPATPDAIRPLGDPSLATALAAAAIGLGVALV